MNPDTNKFEPLRFAGEIKIKASEAEAGGEDILSTMTRELERRAGQETARMMEATMDKLVRPDGSPVPKHWSVFTTGEVVTVKGYGFKVAHIGEAHLLLEPSGPVLVGNGEHANPMAVELDARKAMDREAAQALIKEIGAPGPESVLETCKRAAAEVAWYRRLSEERLVRCRLLWNAVARLTTEVSRALSCQAGHSQPSTTAREVLRVAKVVQEGGPLGHQGKLEPEDSMSLDDLDRVSGARTRMELERLAREREAAQEAELEHDFQEAGRLTDSAVADAHTDDGGES